MSNDILDDLRRLSPDLDALGEQWPAHERAELVDRIRSSEAPGPLPRIGRRRVVAGSLLVAATVAAAVTVPSLLPSDAPGAANPAAAAALDRLSRIAQAAPVDIAGPDQFLHLVVDEHDVGFLDDGTGRRSDLATSYETWTGSRGQVWQRQSGSQADFFPAHDGDTTYITSLPTDTDELNDYLRSHASGSDSVDEAVFVAIGDLLRGANVPAALRSAALGVLAETDHVTVGPSKVDWHGRPVEEFDFIDNSLRLGVVESLFFDPHTAALLDERTTDADPASVRSSSVLVSDVVDAVPPEVVRTAVRQK